MRISGPSLDMAKNKIRLLLNKDVRIKVNHGRNRVSVHSGQVSEIYPSIFTFDTGNVRLSFSYSDVLTGTVRFYRPESSD